MLIDFFHSSAFDWDKHLFQFINGHHSPFWDKVMWAITTHGFGMICMLLTIIAIVLLYRKQSWKVLLFMLVTMTVADNIGSRVIKPWAQRPRPSRDAEYFADYEVHLHQRKDGTYYRGGKYSWPSNHAINFMTASLLCFYFVRPKVKRRGWLALLLFGTTFAVCYSRVYVGVHYPFDIFCGWILAAFLAGIAILMASKWLMPHLNELESRETA